MPSSLDRQRRVTLSRSVAAIYPIQGTRKRRSGNKTRVGQLISSQGWGVSEGARRGGDAGRPEGPPRARRPAQGMRGSWPGEGAAALAALTPRHRLGAARLVLHDGCQVAQQVVGHGVGLQWQERGAGRCQGRCVGNGCCTLPHLACTIPSTPYIEKAPSRNFIHQSTRCNPPGAPAGWRRGPSASSRPAPRSPGTQSWPGGRCGSRLSTGKGERGKRGERFV